MTFTTLEFAESLDNQDSLRKYRDEFVIPTLRDISNGDSGKGIDVLCVFLFVYPVQ